MEWRLLGHSPEPHRPTESLAICRPPQPPGPKILEVGASLDAGRHFLTDRAEVPTHDVYISRHACVALRAIALAALFVACPVVVHRIQVVGRFGVALVQMPVALSTANRGLAVFIHPPGFPLGVELAPGEGHTSADVQN